MSAEASQEPSEPSREPDITEAEIETRSGPALSELPSCASCHYYAATPFKSGECRRNAPTPAILANAIDTAHWPRVDPTDWCGEYARRWSDVRRLRD